MEACKDYWKNMDLKKSIPENVITKKDIILVTEGIKEVHGTKVFYREATPPPQSEHSSSRVSLLLLHGKMFSSKTWLDLGTLQVVAATGFRAVAIDLPGFGNSPAADTPDRAVFLDHVIECFDLLHPVIVSPSLSGLFSLPYLLSQWHKVAGFVPVAPIGTGRLEELPPCSNPEAARRRVPEALRHFLSDPVPDLSDIQTPTLVVFGERDRSRSSALLSLLPVCQCQEIPNGGHPAYLDDPELWHTLLYNFLLALERTYCLQNTA